jgi:hypothetical protein
MRCAWSARVFACCALLIGACSGEEDLADAGDASALDAGSLRDASDGAFDASRADAAMPFDAGDASALDAGPVRDASDGAFDASRADAAVPLDASDDAALRDAALLDGSVLDASPRDADVSSPCARANGGCDVRTTCTAIGATVTCGPCPAGFRGDGASGCMDVDECAVDNGGCDPRTVCANAIGSSACGPCPPGFRGDGVSGCVDIDECATGNGGCDPRSPCLNTIGGRTCGPCPSGFTGDGATGCRDVNECATGNGGCDPRTTCIDVVGGRTCGACPPGWSGSGATGCTCGRAPTDELCDGIDNDCDGRVDERTDDGAGRGWRDPMVQIGPSLWMYAYEASRVDASAATQGRRSDRACARPGVMPWSRVSHDQAAAACAAVRDSLGNPMRLCTAAEWRAACVGPGGGAATSSYSYTASTAIYQSGVCNDRNARAVPAAWATGTDNGFTTRCAVDHGVGRVFDLSGNLAEWTATPAPVSTPTPTWALRGGSYFSYADGVAPDGISCQIEADWRPGDLATDDVGFRCCAGAAP